MTIVYAGDGKIGGAANYLLSVLRRIKAKVIHIPPEKRFSADVARGRADAVILSDYPRERLSEEADRLLAERAAAGMGLLMIGGWASFSARYGGWRGSAVASLLPVECLGRDDRINLPQGALIVPEASHPMFRGLSLARPPVICGYNRTRLKRGARLLWSARPIVGLLRSGDASPEIRLKSSGDPLLAVDPLPGRRIAALTTDVAPHWCGGFVDWGSRRVQLPVSRSIVMEVGDRYAAVLGRLIGWLASASRKPPA